MAKKPAAAPVDVSLMGHVVLYTVSEKQAASHKAQFGTDHETFVALVTSVDDTGATLCVFLPTGGTLHISGAFEGDGPHTWRRLG